MKKITTHYIFQFSKNPFLLGTLFILFNYVLIYLILNYNIYTQFTKHEVPLFWCYDPEKYINKLIYLIIPIMVIISFFISKKVNLESKLFRYLIYILIPILCIPFLNVPEVGFDHYLYFLNAKYLEEHGILSYISNWGNDFYVGSSLPLVPSIFGIIFYLFGESRLIVQLFSVIAFTGIITLTYEIGKRIGNKDIGLFASLLLLSFPFALSQIPLLMVDIMTTFFITLSAFLLLVSYENKNNIYMVICSITIFFAIFTKMTAFIFIGSIILSVVLIEILRERTQKKVLILKTSSIVILSLLLILMFFFLKMDFFIKNFQMTYELFTSSKIDRGLFEMTKSAIMLIYKTSNPLFYLSSLPLGVGLLASFLAILAIFIFIKDRNINLIFPFLWFVIPILLLPTGWFRYYLPSYPAIALMSAFSLDYLRKLRFKDNVLKFILFSLVLTSLSISYLIYLPLEKNHSSINIKSVSEWLEKNENINTITLFYTGNSYKITLFNNDEAFEPMFDYYISKKIIFGGNINPDYNSKGSKIYYPSKENDAIIQIIDNEFRQGALLPDRITDGYRLITSFDKSDYGYWSALSVRLYIKNEIVNNEMFSTEIMEDFKKSSWKTFFAGEGNVEISKSETANQSTLIMKIKTNKDKSIQSYGIFRTFEPYYSIENYDGIVIPIKSTASFIVIRIDTSDQIEAMRKRIGIYPNEITKIYIPIQTLKTKTYEIKAIYIYEDETTLTEETETTFVMYPIEAIEFKIKSLYGNGVL